MKWENLKENRCPHCSAPLVFDGNNEIECTMCRFHIEPVRYKLMLTHRGIPGNAKYRLKWQYLTAGRCPRCTEKLVDDPDESSLKICLRAPECPFNIRFSKMVMILGDPLHPAHQFKIDDDTY